MARAIVLHMGFVNTPYTKKAMAAPVAFAKAQEKKRHRSFSSTMSATQVAGILEAKYKVVETFTAVHDGDIREILSETFRDAIIKTFSERKKFASDRMVQYMKPKTDQIQKLFRVFLDNEETGAAVAAATKGNRTGRKSKSPRPPFIDTGIYRASFRCWADIK
jgi:hypothetical protein